MTVSSAWGSTSGTKPSGSWSEPHDGLDPPAAVGRRLASVTARRITSAAASGVKDAFIRWTPARKAGNLCGSAARWRSR